MKSINPENLSPFGKHALKLDHEFQELVRIGGQIERIAIDSDSGLERSIKLLAEFAEHGQGITDLIADFSQALEQSRHESETIARKVAEKAQEIQKRKEELDAMESKFAALAAQVKETSESIGKTRPEQTGDADMPSRIREADASLATFLDQAQAIKEEAFSRRLTRLERNAESLCGTLKSARRKLGAAIEATIQ